MQAVFITTDLQVLIDSITKVYISKYTLMTNAYLKRVRKKSLIIDCYKIWAVIMGVEIRYNSYLLYSGQ